MPTPDDASRAESLAEELSDCRQRGIEWLDRDTHNQKRVAAPELTRLAAGYASRRHMDLRGRIPQIKALLRDALAAFERSDRDFAGLIRALLFGSDTGMVRKGPTELLRDARRQYGNPTENRFREMRAMAFRGFAEFLIEFAEAGTGASLPTTSSRDQGVQTAGLPSPAGADRRMVPQRLEAVLRFSYEEPGGTDAVTIEEHQRIIDQHGRCWWGWFKARHDDDHTPDMAARLRNCEVGLWERAESLYYVAHCDEVVVGDGGPIESPDKDLTPAYYRGQPYPAWLSLRSIRESSRQEFTERFGDLPTAVATVHWSPQRTPEPVVVQAEGNSILHLADLRFGHHHRWSTAAVPRRNFVTTEQAIARALLVHEVDLATVGVVVICGNFVSGDPTADAYGEALAFVEGLCEQLPNVQREDIVIVPGADDFARPGDRERSEQGLYREFYQNLYGVEEADLTQMRRYEFPGFRVNLLPVNSVKMLGVHERDDGLFGYGYDAQLNLMLDDYLRHHGHTGVVNVVAAHHHLVPTPVQLPDNPQLPLQERVMLGIHDAGSVLDKLSAMRVALFLHGHLHQARYRIVTSDDGWQTAVCGAGTAGASESWLRENYRENHTDSLALYDVQEDRIRGRMMVYDETFRRLPAPREFQIKL